MSKPETPGELRNVRVDMVSLVHKAANGETYKIFKSDKSAGEQPPAASAKAEAPETVTKDERGLFHVLKSFFSGESVEKGAVAAIVEAQNNGQKLDQAIGALFSVLGISRWGDPKAKPETDAAKIRAALTDFKNVAEDILIGKDEDVKKAVEEVQKSGRKISGSRLSKIKEAYATLGDLIAETDTDNTEGEASEVTKEELAQVVKTSVDEAVKLINERIEALEKSEADRNAAVQAAPEVKEAPDIGAVVKEAVEKAMEPLTERVEKIEKARGFSNRQTEETKVQKSESDFWGGVFGA